MVGPGVIAYVADCARPHQNLNDRGGGMVELEVQGVISLR
jgi:hypothetical protein